jgi:hypothetical protein
LPGVLRRRGRDREKEAKNKGGKSRRSVDAKHDTPQLLVADAGG